MLVDLLAQIYRAPRPMRRLYWLAMTAIAAAITVLTVTFWLEGILGSYADLQDRRATLGNMFRIIEAGARSESNKAATEQASHRTFLQGGSRAVVGASLQSWLGAAVQESGAQLQSIENSALSEAEAKSYVGLSANVAGTWKSVQSIIFRIETAEPALTIQSVELQSYSYGAADDVEPSVTMQISIRGAINEGGS
jgi:hypothetical protein